MRLANPITVAMTPTLSPTSLMSGLVLNEAAAGEASDTNAPEKNPYTIPNTTVPAVVVAPSNAKTNPAVITVDGIMMLKTPCLSARRFGTILPKIDETFMIEIFCKE